MNNTWLARSYVSLPARLISEPGVLLPVTPSASSMTVLELIDAAEIGLLKFTASHDGVTLAPDLPPTE